MNDFERANLARLAQQNEEVQTIKALIESANRQSLSEAVNEAAKLYVAALFELHRGDKAKVKAQIRQDGELFIGLDLTQQINDSYKEYAQRTARYDDRLHAKFELWFARLRATGESDPCTHTTG